MIPGATKAADKLPVPNSICGQGAGLITLPAGTATATVCSKPLSIIRESPAEYHCSVVMLPCINNK